MLNNFPKIDIPSDRFICKKVEADIEGEKGYFYGSVNNTTSSPDGYGVFDTGDWVNCGKVENGHYTDGRRVSINSEAKVFKLVNKQSKADGSIFEKVESYSKEEVDCSFIING